VRGTDTALSFDVNYWPGGWPGRMAAPILRRLPRQSDIVLVELHERGCCEAPEPQRRPLTHRDGQRPRRQRRRTGSHRLDGTTETFVPALGGRCFEPAGAGDALVARYLSALLRQEPPAARLGLGHLLTVRVRVSTHVYPPGRCPTTDGNNAFDMAGSEVVIDPLEVGPCPKQCKEPSTSSN